MREWYNSVETDAVLTLIKLKLISLKHICNSNSQQLIISFTASFFLILFYLGGIHILFIITMIVITFHIIIIQETLNKLLLIPHDKKLGHIHWLNSCFFKLLLTPKSLLMSQMGLAQENWQTSYLGCYSSDANKCTVNKSLIILTHSNLKKNVLKSTTTFHVFCQLSKNVNVYKLNLQILMAWKFDPSVFLRSWIGV